MKPILKTLWIFIAFLYASISVYSYDFEVGGIYYTKQSDPYSGTGTVWVTSNPVKLYSGDITIPKTVQKDGYTYRVIGVSNNTFKDCVDLTSVKFLFNDDIEIGFYAFSGCTNLKEVRLPSNLTGIPRGAFKNCSSLDCIETPSTVRIIESEAFANCIGMKTFIVPKSLLVLGLKAFDNCNSLQHVFFLSHERPYFDCEGDDEKQVFSNCNTKLSLWVPDENIYQFGKEYISFEKNEFQYSGNKPAINIINNLSSYQYTIELPNIEKDFGQYETSINIEYAGDVRFNVTIPYLYFITKAPLFVKVEDAERQYGQENPIFTLKYDGFKNSENTSELWQLPEIRTEATKDSPVGLYSLTVEGGTAKNYEFVSYYSGNLSILPAPLKLIVQNAEREYYTNNPEFKYSLVGFLNNDDSTCLSSIPSLSCSATIDSDCGEYEISASGAIAKNYNISYEVGKLNVLPAPLSLSAKNSQREYGEENPILEYEAQGLKGNDTKESALQEQPTLTATCNRNSNVGNYPITISGGKAKNYTLSYLSGSLTVAKAPINLAVINANRFYGTHNPKFEFHVEGLKLDETQNTVFSQLPLMTTDATEKSDVGEYLVSIAGGIAKNYEIKEYKPGKLTIEKAPLALTAKDTERIYFSENPEFSFTLDGLLNDDTYSCISKLPLYNCEATLESECGRYSIMPSNAESKNYDISYKGGTLTVTPANLMLVASNTSREFGEVNPVLKYEAIGLKGDDDIQTALIDEPVLSTIATENSNVGEYTISINGGSSKNYKLNYRNGVLNITKAPLTIIVDDAERVYGDNNPPFSRSYLGFKLNDNESTSFSSLPKITCAATRTSNVGEYPIVVNGGTSRNYEIVSYENGVLNITKAPLTLVATDNSRLYFEDNPTFDFTLIGLRNSDTKSCLSTQPTFKCAAVMTSDTGEYEIEPLNATAQNYTIDYKKGILSINKRALTASVGNYTKIYGSENPQFEIEYIGFVNNEDISALTNAPNIVCSANKSSDVGSYPISLDGGNAQNYYISKYNSGTLTIEKANQIITWNQDLSNIQMYSQVALEASSSSGLPVSYEMAPNNVATLYSNAGKWYLDCFGSGAVNIRAVQNGDKNYNEAPMVSNTLVVIGTGGDPSNPQIFLNIENAGTLPNLIADNRKYQIKNLRLTGYLNGTDINFLREMAGSDSYGSSTPGVLETLDISGCTIVSGGRSYYKSCQTSNNKVGDYMFYNCKQLINLMLPENTTAIEDYAFADCDRLSVISIPDKVKLFGVQSFRNDISLLRIPMPSSLTSIKDYAFMGCDKISEITIPANVTNIGDGIVKDCQNISKINVAEGNNQFASENGVLFTSTFDELLIFPVNYESNSYVVKDGTKIIAPYAFGNSKKLREVGLPSTLTNIGEDAFIGCVNLSSLQVKALNPPVCNNDCFEAVSKTRCELIVPKGCYHYYWVAPVWSGFNKIKESEFISSEDDILYNDIKVDVENSNIIINGVPVSIQVHIFKVDGTLIYQGQSTGDVIYYRPAQSGIYIVVIANKTYKLNVY